MLPLFSFTNTLAIRFTKALDKNNVFCIYMYGVTVSWNAINLSSVKKQRTLKFLGLY